MDFLKIQHVTKTYGNFVALYDINFTVEKGEFVCLLGPSGCGKTTLLRIIAGLEQPNAGSKIVMGGQDVTKWPPHKRDFGIVFQSYALFPNLTVAQNIAYGLKSKRLSKSDIKEKVQECLAQVNLERVRDHYPTQLSGGQQQRVALARALALSPSFLLLDEPLSALDAKVRMHLRMEIRHLQEQLGVTTIMVTHDQEEALSMGDKIVVMNDACIEQIGSPIEVYEQPITPFVADFIGTANFIKNALGSVVAIRPENIVMSEIESEDSIRAVVEAVEFRGSLSRVYLQLEKNSDIQLERNLLVVDLPINQARNVVMQKGKEMFVTFFQDRLITYDQSGRSEGGYSMPASSGISFF
ncbi:iron(III) transport system ATP-binding protein [Bacillus thermophilus]|uniref:Iron(III) transport system ATP-binding protein n=1 Tax=Siminovitchia thermophila TaxID=1245522 RepID=A0ABS2RB48_9BACI|nr:ATP-binding cassette domain-containing protein [Siminovitchia thermophila]MBM7716585.1 iron(III) transport system ATP-binding protein [Siminovitchia thermophila]